MEAKIRRGGRQLLHADGALLALSAAGHLWVACGRRGEKKSGIARVDVDSGDATPWAETDWTIYDLAVADDHLLAAPVWLWPGPQQG